jgi:hypothetical protein
MLREGPIPAVVQGVIEYALGLLLIAAPFLFGYDDLSTPLGISIALGVVLLIVAAISEGPTGLVKQMPVTVHVTVDFLLSIVFIAAPFVLGFGDEAAPRNLFIALGVVFLLVTIGTRYRDSGAKRSAGGAGSSSTGAGGGKHGAAPASGQASSRSSAGAAGGSRPATGGSRGGSTSPGATGGTSGSRTPPSAVPPPPARPGDTAGDTPRPPTP